MASDSYSVFAGAIPDIYERFMVPLVFAPFAEEVAERVAALNPDRILETAAGTGVVTEAVNRTLPRATIVATDLNQPMLDIAARKLVTPNVSFRTADAQALPFPDSSFDLVVCQFGVMFFPNKVVANREARRVLVEGGHYVLVIWDRVERNVATHIAGRAVADLFPQAAGKFYERVPFRYHDPVQIRADLAAAGFGSIRIETIERASHVAFARDAAIALVQGTPMRTDIEEIGPDSLERATYAAERALGLFEGPSGFSAPMSAHIVTAIR